jgi:transcriptional regulator with XRE-family HTH domain
MERHDSFGEWLRQRRRAFDLTQAELAERVGCSVVKEILEAALACPEVQHDGP